mgnify:CR=1 FL=1
MRRAVRFSILRGMERIVLVVDDSLVARLGMKNILKDSGFSMAESASGEDALERIRGGLSPAAVLLDLTMPGIGGIETLRELKRLAPGLPVLVVTADIQRRTLEEARAAGAFDVLRKPADRAAVLDALGRAAGLP